MPADHDQHPDHEHIGPDGKVYRRPVAVPVHRHASHPDDEGEHDHVGPDGRVFRHSHHGNGPRVDAAASANRRRFAEAGVFVMTLLSNPGAGKTTLLARTLTELKNRVPMAAVVDDPRTGLDAARLRATGAAVVQAEAATQSSTGRLDAMAVGAAADRLGLAEDSVLFIEAAPIPAHAAGADLGETHRILLLPVTEGEDRPLKHPDLIAAADLLVVTKTDLLPHLSMDVERLIDHAQRLKPSLAVIALSATSGQGLRAWYDWIEDGLAEARAGR
ncbi:hydrogenase nickel incorporation protein HypB [Azospirillum doebereinerae]|uniref:Hydrogenase maturation factor HypB n=1 Tax=Azospirillum doebereinerae TaxID=92933 RepID=A0A433J7L3_9PROT|nr:hydrogenase nickel incorporation protein HypB [Azospirillum doebereinerae]RUQ69668.1 hydrogenase accessory protein HypB [Azospirillum doebereinerae]